MPGLLLLPVFELLMVNQQGRGVKSPPPHPQTENVIRRVKSVKLLNQLNVLKY